MFKNISNYLDNENTKSIGVIVGYEPITPFLAYDINVYISINTIYGRPFAC